MKQNLWIPQFLELFNRLLAVRNRHSPREGLLLRLWPLTWMHWQCGILLGFVVLSACGQGTDTVLAIAIHPTKSNIVYVATEEAVYKTANNGIGWRRLNGELSRARVITLSVDPELPANVFAGTMADGTYKSPDGGRRWLPFNQGLQKGTISANVNAVVFKPESSEIIYAATTTGIFQSTDGGRTWTERMAGMTEISFVVSLAIDPKRSHILYAGTSGGVFRSKNGSESWVKVNNGLVPADTKMASMALGVNALVVDPADTDTVFAGTTRGLFKTTNQGQTWNQIGSASLGKPYISSIALVPTITDVVYVATSQGVLMSLNGGQSWQPTNQGLDTLNIRAMGMDTQDPQTLYVGTNGGGLYRTTNGGSSWTKVPLKLEEYVS